MTEFYIVRHGKTDANLAGIKQGTINTEITHLNALGKQQAQTLHTAFEIQDFDQIFVSPLIRTQQTAQILNQTAHLPVHLDARLLEISYGDWDGQLNADLEHRYPDYFNALIHDVTPNYAHIAFGETFTHVEARVANFIQEITHVYPTQKILVVTHGFTARSFAINATQSHGLTILEPDNCSVSKIIVAPKTFEQHLIYYNRSVQGF